MKMEKLNRNTKKAQYYIALWETSDEATLQDVYKSWSKAKERAYDNIMQRYLNDSNAYNLRIISHTTRFFSTGYGLYSRDTAELFAVIIDTSTKTYYISMEE